MGSGKEAKRAKKIQKRERRKKGKEHLTGNKNIEKKGVRERGMSEREG